MVRHGQAGHGRPWRSMSAGMAWHGRGATWHGMARMLAGKPCNKAPLHLPTCPMTKLMATIALCIAAALGQRSIACMAQRKRHGTWHGMAWHGMAWHETPGMAWHGMAWHGSGSMKVAQAATVQ